MKNFDHSHMFSIIESKCWISNDGRRASLYGSVPWTSEEDKNNWKIEIVGFTVQHKKTGIVGIGRKPWATYDEAYAWLTGEAV